MLQDRLRAEVRDIAVTRAARRSILQARTGATTTSGRPSAEVIQGVVRQSFGSFKRCYEDGLRKDPKLAGGVAVTFTIDQKGATKDASATGDIPDKQVIDCIRSSFVLMVFPAPEGGVVKVTYPISFAPGDSPVTSTPGGASESAPSAPLAPASSPAVAPAKTASPEDGAERWPIAVIGDKEIFLDGEVVGSATAIVNLQRLQKIDALFNGMKERRDLWKVAHPDRPFPGVAGLRTRADTPLLVLKSVYQTMAFAGWPDIFVQSEEEPGAIFGLAAQIPAPPDPSPAAPAEPEPLLALRFNAEQAISLVWKKDGAVLSEESVPAAAPALAAKICAGWKAQGAHRDPTDGFRDAIIVSADDRSPFGALSRVLRAVEGCTREVRPLGGAPRTAAAFWITFSVR